MSECIHSIYVTGLSREEEAEDELEIIINWHCAKYKSTLACVPERYRRRPEKLRGR